MKKSNRKAGRWFLLMVMAVIMALSLQPLRAFAEDGQEAMEESETTEDERIEVGGTINWKDADDQDGIRPDSVTVRLYQNDEQINYADVYESNDHTWSYRFTELPRYDSGEMIRYTITVDDVSGYSPVINTYDVELTHIPETTDVIGKVIWEDGEDQDGIRPACVTVNLMKDGMSFRTLELNEDEEEEHNWEISFEGLPKYEGGSEMIYTLEVGNEFDIDCPYAVTVSDYDITFIHTPGKVDIPVVVNWQDDDNRDGIRPASVTVKLLAGDEVTDKSIELYEDNSWQTAFPGLYAYWGDQEISYSIEAEPVSVITGTDAVGTYACEAAGTSADGYVFTYTHTPEKIRIDVEVRWDDNDDQDGKRPDKVFVNLVNSNNGKVLYDRHIFRDACEQKDGSWKASFTDVLKYDKGVEIQYGIEVDHIDDYTTVVNGWVITNSYTPGTTGVSGHVTWSDGNDVDGKRPEYITVWLHANGEPTKSVDVYEGEGGGWSFNFTDLATHQDGIVLNYTVWVDEDPFIGTYEIWVTNYNIEFFHEPEKVSVPVQVKWEDSEDQDGILPKAATVKLYADGEYTDSVDVYADEQGIGCYTFSGLPKYGNDKLITYTIVADFIDGYTALYNGNSIKLIHVPVKVKIPVEVKWEDDNDRDGLRPPSVILKLLADGSDTGETIELGDENSWKSVFGWMPKMKDNREIVYTVEEAGASVITGIDAEGTYACRITGSVKDGYVVTNTHTPMESSIMIRIQEPGGRELAGAGLKLEEYESRTGKTTAIEEWISDGESKTVVLKTGSYILTQTAAPDGYDPAEAIHFTVGADGSVKVNGLAVSRDEISGSYILDMVDKYVPADPENPEEQHTHDYVRTIKAQPTCVETGIAEYKCSCGDAYQTIISATGHVGRKEIRDVVEATCLAKGYTGDTYCKTCGQMISSGEETPLADHSYGEKVITRVESFDEEGEESLKCTVCGHEETHVIPKLERIDLSQGKIVGIGNKSATGIAIIQTNYGVYIDDICLREGEDYTVSYIDNVNPGTATMVVTGKGAFKGEIRSTFTISKRNQAISGGISSKKIKVKSVKKKTQKFSIGATASTTVTYKLAGYVDKKTKKAKKYFKVASNGTVTVKKGCMKGTYKLKITMSAAGDAYYNAAPSVTKKITIKVK